ncbi:MAG: hypothetical protein FJ403_09095 [Verrucomicrobia bacterium]|nr:hypothetical protein [Verrucomicrobiota bacterium]
MKAIIAVVASLGVSVAGTYVVVSKTKEAAFQRERQALQAEWAVVKAELEGDLKVARNKPARVETIRVPSSEAGASRQSPQEILEKLKNTKVGTGSKRSATIRDVVHQLESLAESGPDAVTAIREFLARFEDMDYSTEAMRAARELGDPPGPERLGRDERADAVAAKAPGSHRNPARLDFVLPPSLRLGLVDVLREIGGDEAEKVLAETLSATGRGVEVAYLAKVLQEIAPNKYRNAAVTAAKDLLSNPPTIEKPNRLDEDSKSYLYGVLAMYNDSSFTTAAHDVIVTADGKIDRTALEYVTTTFKDQAIPVLYQAYKDRRITNLWDRASLAGQALNYAGANPQANDLFKELVHNETFPSWMRAMTIQSLAGTGFFGGNTPTDRQQVQSRLNLLTALPPFADEQMERARKETVERLNNTLSGKSEAEPQGGPKPAQAAPLGAAESALPR